MNSTLDQKEFQELFRAYYNPLTNFAARIIGDKDAEDVVQDVFIQIWQGKGKLIIKSARGLLFQSVYHKCLEKLQKNLKEKQTLTYYLEMKNSEKWIEREADNYVLKEKISSSIRQLPPKCKEVFELSKYNGLTYSEIALKLNISEKTVENHIITAFKKLRILLSESK
jgi:RNA polymerase sigma-70 factor (ECF subfamily)